MRVRVIGAMGTIGKGVVAASKGHDVLARPHVVSATGKQSGAALEPAAR